jgi:hypothetical protein
MKLKIKFLNTYSLWVLLNMISLLESSNWGKLELKTVIDYLGADHIKSENNKNEENKTQKNWRIESNIWECAGTETITISLWIHF